MINHLHKALIAAGLILSSGMMAAGGLQQNFESDNALKSCLIKGNAGLRIVSGTWQTVSAKFNSKNNNQVLIVLRTARSSTGRIQFDNVRFSPAVKVSNADFEGKGGWGNSGNHAKIDTENASSGQCSIYGEFPLDTSPAIDIRQTVKVSPNTDYEMKIDVLVTDSFEGEAQILIFDAGGWNCLVQNWHDVQLSRFTQIRDHNGRNVLEMRPRPGQNAEVTFQIPKSTASEYKRLKMEILPADHNGKTAIKIRDKASGRITETVEISGGSKDWVKISRDIMLPAQAELQITAAGSGQVWLDNIDIGTPGIIPTPQQVVWSQNYFAIPKALTVAVKGDGGEPFKGAMELLSKDLAKYQIRLAKGAFSRAKVKLYIGSEYAVKGHEKEGYTLKSDRNGVEIKAAAPAGAFYGMMSLLQLITSIEGKPYIIGCSITDYPDMELRGILYAPEETAARYKMNTVMTSTGYMDVNSDSYKNMLANQAKLNLECIPYFLSLATHNMMIHKDPNVLTGIEITDEKVTLNGTSPAKLAKPFVLRSKLARIKVRSAAGRVFEENKDYTVAGCQFNSNFDPNIGNTSTTLTRTAGSAIANGETVLVSYNYVNRERGTFKSVHIPYIPFEPVARKAMDGHLETLSEHTKFKYFLTGLCIFEFFPIYNQLATDSRIKQAKLTDDQIYIKEALAQTRALKKHDPEKRLWIWTGSNTPLAKKIAPHLDRSTVVQIWGYDANWVDSYGQEAMDMWSKLGYSTAVMPWSNLRNIRTYAQLVKYAKDKSYPVLGMIGSCWGQRTSGVAETAETAWRIPRPGEKSYVKINWK